VDTGGKLLYNAPPQLHCMRFRALSDRLVERQGAGSAERACCSARHLMGVEEGWGRLPEHWRGAFRQAWAAYVAGTMPGGAVVVEPYGVIPAEAQPHLRRGYCIHRRGAPDGPHRCALS
jgi:hypothetical protein